MCSAADLQSVLEHTDRKSAVRCVSAQCSCNLKNEVEVSVQQLSASAGWRSLKWSKTVILNKTDSYKFGWNDKSSRMFLYLTSRLGSCELWFGLSSSFRLNMWASRLMLAQTKHFDTICRLKSTWRCAVSGREDVSSLISFQSLFKGSVCSCRAADRKSKRWQTSRLMAAHETCWLMEQPRTTLSSLVRSIKRTCCC